MVVMVTSHEYRPSPKERVYAESSREQRTRHSDNDWMDRKEN
jgi:hypothetical protein